MTNIHVSGKNFLVCSCGLAAVVWLLTSLGGCVEAQGFAYGASTPSVTVHYTYVAMGGSERVRSLALMPSSPGLYVPSGISAPAWYGSTSVDLSTALSFVRNTSMAITNQSEGKFVYWFKSIWDASPIFRGLCRQNGMQAPNQAGLPDGDLDVQNLDWDDYVMDYYLESAKAMNKKFGVQRSQSLAKDREIGVFFVDNPSGLSSLYLVGRFQPELMLAMINRRMLEVTYLERLEPGQFPDGVTDELAHLQAREVAHEVFHYVLDTADHHLNIVVDGENLDCCFYQLGDLEDPEHRDRKAVYNLCNSCWGHVAAYRSFWSF